MHVFATRACCPQPGIDTADTLPMECEAGASHSTGASSKAHLNEIAFDHGLKRSDDSAEREGNKLQGSGTGLEGLKQTCPEPQQGQPAEEEKHVEAEQTAKEGEGQADVRERGHQGEGPTGAMQVNDADVEETGHRGEDSMRAAEPKSVEVEERAEVPGKPQEPEVVALDEASKVAEYLVAKDVSDAAAAAQHGHNCLDLGLPEGWGGLKYLSPEQQSAAVPRAKAKPKAKGRPKKNKDEAKPEGKRRARKKPEPKEKEVEVEEDGGGEEAQACGVEAQAKKAAQEEGKGKGDGPDPGERRVRRRTAQVEAEAEGASASHGGKVARASKANRRGKAREDQEGGPKRRRTVKDDPKEALRSKGCCRYQEVYRYLTKHCGVPEEDARYEARIVSLQTYGEGISLEKSFNMDDLLLLFRRIPSEQSLLYAPPPGQGIPGGDRE